MVGQIYLFVIMAMTLVASTAFSKPLNEKVWKFSPLGPQIFLFENQSSKTTVLLTISATSMSNEQAQKYILSREFLNDAKLSRTATILSSGDEPVEGGSGFPELIGSVNASREEIEKFWVGVIETDFGVEGRSALMSERLWVRDGLLFHMLIGSQGTLTPSSESHQKVFAEFQSDLGFRNEKTASVFDFLIDSANAIEIGRSRKAQPRQQNARQQAVGRVAAPRANPKSECQAFVDEEGIDPSRVRQSKDSSGNVTYGPPKLYLGADLTACEAGATKAYNEMKEAVLGTVNALSDWSENLKREAGADMAKYTKLLSCDRMLEVDRGNKNESWGTSFLRSLKNSQSRVAYSKCLESAGNMTNGAMIARRAESVSKSAAQATKSAGDAVSKYWESDGPTRTAKAFASFMSTPIDNPATALYRYIDSQIKGFRCLTNSEQSAVVCSFLAHKASVVAVGAATAGAGVVVIRGVKAAGAIAQRLQAANKAVKGIKDHDVKGATASATGATEGTATAATSAAAQSTATTAAAQSTATSVTSTATNTGQTVATRALGELKHPEKLKERAEARHIGRYKAFVNGNDLGANISRAERGRRAEKLMGRKLTEDEIDVLQGMHEIGGGRGYRPSGTRPNQKIEGVLTPADLRAKIKYAEGANPKGIKLDPKLVSASLRTGLTGERSIAAQREVVARFTKDWKDDLDKLNDPKLTQQDLATKGLTVKASDMTYMRIKALDEADFKNVEVFTDNNDHVQLLRFATHSGHTTASETGEVMAQMVRAVPADKREDYFESLQIFIESQTKSSYSASQRAADHGRFGENLKDTVGAMYRELKANPPEGITPQQLERLRIESQSLVTRARDEARNRAPSSASKPAKPEVEVMHNWRGR